MCQLGVRRCGRTSLPDRFLHPAIPHLGRATADSRGANAEKVLQLQADHRRRAGEPAVNKGLARRSASAVYKQVHDWSLDRH
jgi:hypothetical protein